MEKLSKFRWNLKWILKFVFKETPDERHEERVPLFLVFLLTFLFVPSKHVKGAMKHWPVNPQCLLCETFQTEVWVCGVNVEWDNSPSRAELSHPPFLLSSFSPSQLHTPVVLSPQLLMFLLVYVIIYKLALWNSWKPLKIPICSGAFWFYSLV